MEEAIFDIVTEHVRCCLETWLANNDLTIDPVKCERADGEIYWLILMPDFPTIRSLEVKITEYLKTKNIDALAEIDGNVDW